MKGLLLFAWLLPVVDSFSTHHSTTLFDPLRQATTPTTSTLDASNNRMFNLNDKGGPFGFDYNAEIWNGRVAQLSFAWVFGQEWMQDKGLLQGIADQDPGSVVALGLFMTLVGFLSLRFVLEPPKEAFHHVEKMKLSHPTAYRHAKSFMELFDPERDPEEMTVNFNDQGSPFGFKKNAEIWNGRIAMVSFVWVFVQEMLSGKGILDGIAKQEGGPLAALVCFLTLMTGFTGMVTDEDNQEKDFVEKVVSIEKLQSNVDMDWKPDTVDRPYDDLPPTLLAKEESQFSVSDPPTYEVYMKERERLAALEQARLYEESLREMTRGRAISSRQQQPPPSYHVVQASNPSPKWELSFSDSLKAMTSERSSAHPDERPLPQNSEMPKAFSDEPRRKINEVAAPPMVITATPRQETNEKRTIVVKENLPFASPSVGGAKALDPDYSMLAYDTARYSFELAELWNGRFAQELAQGRGVLQGIEMGNSINLAGMLTTLLAMIGTGLAFAVNSDERTQTKGVPMPRKDPRVLRELQTRGSDAALSSVAASVATEADAAREKRPKENPSNYKVDGYRFSDLTPQETKFQTVPMPAPSVAPDLEEPFVPPGFVAEPDPSNFKVPGYRFKASPPPKPQPVAHDDTSPHPEGVFSFNSGTTQQIRMGSGQQQPEANPTTSTPGDVRPHPSESFTFGQSTQDLIRAGGIPAIAPPLPVIEQSISSPSFPNKIDIVAAANGSEYTLNEPLSDGRVGTWLADDDNDPNVPVPVMAGKGGSNYLETLRSPSQGGNIRP